MSTRDSRWQGGVAPFREERFNYGLVARFGSIALGIWLFISGYVWQHSSESLVNTWLVAVATVGCATWAFWNPPARWLNMLIAVWLGLSVFAVNEAQPVVWNHLIVAVLLFALSLVPNHPERGNLKKYRRDYPT